MIFDNIIEYAYVSRRGKHLNIFFCSVSVFTCMGSHPFERHQHSCSISIYHELKWIWLLVFHVVYQQSWITSSLYPHTNERCKPVQSMLLDSCSWNIRKYRFSKESWAVPGDASSHTIVIEKSPWCESSGSFSPYLPLADSCSSLQGTHPHCVTVTKLKQWRRKTENSRLQKLTVRTAWVGRKTDGSKLHRAKWKRT